MGRIATTCRTESDPRPIDRLIARLASRQYGVVVLWQLVALGLSASAVRSRVAAGRLHRIHRGVYAVGHPVLKREGRMLAAVLACGPDALLSHRSAAAHWGIRPGASPICDVTIPRGSTRSRPGIRIHRARRLEPARHDGIPITTVARTIVDSAEVLDPRGVERMVERAVMLGLFDLRKLQTETQGRHAAPVLASLLANYRGETSTRSATEELYLRLIRSDATIPHPLVNAQVVGHERDFAWPLQRVIVEIDARSTHDSPGAWERDRLRDQTAIAEGYTVVRFTKRQLETEPAYVIAYTSSIVNASSPTSRNSL